MLLGLKLNSAPSVSSRCYSRSSSGRSTRLVIFWRLIWDITVRFCWVVWRAAFRFPYQESTSSSLYRKDASTISHLSAMTSVRGVACSSHALFRTSYCWLFAFGSHFCDAKIYPTNSSWHGAGRRVSILNPSFIVWPDDLSFQHSISSRSPRSYTT